MLISLKEQWRAVPPCTAPRRDPVTFVSFASGNSTRTQFHSLQTISSHHPQILSQTCFSPDTWCIRHFSFFSIPNCITLQSSLIRLFMVAFTLSNLILAYRVCLYVYYLMSSMSDISGQVHWQHFRINAIGVWYFCEQKSFIYYLYLKKNHGLKTTGKSIGISDIAKVF